MENQNEALDQKPVQSARLLTGVPGLDTLLNGGFIKGGMYLILGPPGSGKTILGNQICFHHVRENGARIVYITLLAESHSRMVESLKNLDFFKDNEVGSSVLYMSGYGILEKEGLPGLLKEIASVVRKHKASILMIDGITTIGDMDQTHLAFRKFTLELNTYIANSNCTAFLLSSMEGSHSSPEHTMVDGIVALHHQKISIRAVRQIEVRKFRGSSHLQGDHLFKITDEGVRVFPRAESLPVKLQQVSIESRRLSFNVPKLDDMLGGGLISNSITTIIGPTGTGKTILGLQFLRAGVEAKEKCLFFGFYETPSDLLEKARKLGFSLDAWVEKGMLTIHRVSALEEELDEIGETLIEIIQRNGAKRVVIDALDGFRNSTSYVSRVNLFLVALVVKLKSLGVTLIIIEETSLYLNHTERKVTELSAMNENLLYLRHVELESKMTRVVSILKIRSAVYDPSVRELKISAKGIDVLGSVQPAEVVTPRKYATTDAIKKSKVKTSSRKGRKK
jgi:circadian clock protein KaiC